jgi:hypothetical protein
VPEYREAQNYVEAPAVRDRGLITASGIADVEFARELFEELGVLSRSDRAVWADIFRNARLPDETKEPHQPSEPTPPAGAAHL